MRINRSTKVINLRTELRRLTWRVGIYPGGYCDSSFAKAALVSSELDAIIEYISSFP